MDPKEVTVRPELCQSLCIGLPICFSTKVTAPSSKLAHNTCVPQADAKACYPYLGVVSSASFPNLGTCLLRSRLSIVSQLRALHSYPHSSSLSLHGTKETWTILEPASLAFMTCVITMLAYLYHLHAILYSALFSKIFLWEESDSDMKYFILSSSETWSFQKRILNRCQSLRRNCERLGRYKTLTKASRP